MGRLQAMKWSWLSTARFFLKSVKNSFEVNLVLDKKHLNEIEAMKPLMGPQTQPNNSLWWYNICINSSGLQMSGLQLKSCKCIWKIGVPCFADIAYLKWGIFCKWFPPSVFHLNLGDHFKLNTLRRSTAQKDMEVEDWEGPLLRSRLPCPWVYPYQHRTVRGCCFYNDFYFSGLFVRGCAKRIGWQLSSPHCSLLFLRLQFKGERLRNLQTSDCVSMDGLLPTP